MKREQVCVGGPDGFCLVFSVSTLSSLSSHATGSDIGTTDTPMNLNPPSTSLRLSPPSVTVTQSQSGRSSPSGSGIGRNNNSMSPTATDSPLFSAEARKILSTTYSDVERDPFESINPVDNDGLTAGDPLTYSSRYSLGIGDSHEPEMPPKNFAPLDGK